MPQSNVASSASVQFEVSRPRREARVNAANEAVMGMLVDLATAELTQAGWITPTQHVDSDLRIRRGGPERFVWTLWAGIPGILQPARGDGAAQEDGVGGGGERRRDGCAPPVTSQSRRRAGDPAGRHAEAQLGADLQPLHRGRAKAPTSRRRGSHCRRADGGVPRRGGGWQADAAARQRIRGAVDRRRERWGAAAFRVRAAAGRAGGRRSAHLDASARAGEAHAKPGARSGWGPG